ncbi:MAG: LytR family transcriptional regulator [Bacillota bacterium]|nr:LytR family transcriptional regulator [Bacillota bacterium]
MGTEIKNNSSNDENRTSTGSGNKSNQTSQKDKQVTPALSFVRTFLLAFVVFVLLCTPGMAIFGEVGDYNILDPEGDDVVLREQFPTIVDENSPFFEAFSNKNRVNVLLLGINGGLTDTIMLASFDTDAKHVDLISVPRDTYYHREGYNSEGENKINAAYRKDPVNTAKAVSEVLLGMPINYYVVVDYDGVAKIVDSMGGVPMDIKFDMKYSDPYDKPPLNINIKKGYQVLDGKTSVLFLRYRKGYLEGDIGRVKAQQEFMKSAFKQSIGLDLPKIAKTVFENVKSDINLGTATKLAKNAMGISAEDIETYMIPATPLPDPPFYVIPNAEGIADMINEIYSIEPKTTTEAAITE